MKRTTIKDLALQLGVNVSTVSRALKGHPDISLEMRLKVQRLAEVLHYTPNTMAVGLRKQQSRLVALVIPEINMFFFPSVIKGVDDVLRQAGLKMMVLQSHDSLDQEIENMRICIESGVEGLLLSVSKSTLNLAHLAELKEHGIPIVLFDRIVDNSEYDCVVIDDVLTAEQAVGQLIESGCNNIAGLFGNPNLYITQLRVEGFRKALLSKGLPLHRAAVQFACSPEEASEAVLKLKQLEYPEMDGMFVMSDELLAGVASAARQTNLRIPGDFSLICISDGFLPYFVFPNISFLHHSGYEVGQIAARRLLKLIQMEPDHTLEKHVVETKLVHPQ